MTRTFAVRHWFGFWLTKTRCANVLTLSFKPKIRFSTRQALNCSREITTASSLDSYEVNGRIIREIRDKQNEVLDRYDTILCDCDGVLWKTDHTTPIPRISETIAYLRSLGKRMLFVTNNSMYDRKRYSDKFQKYGFQVDIKDIICVAYAASVYLKEVMHVGAVYVLGSEGMEYELNQMGVNNFGCGPDLDVPSSEKQNLLEMEFRDDVNAVLVGFDMHFSYNKLYKAASYLSNPACQYVATSDIEMGIMIGPNRKQPVTGVLVKAVELACNRVPTVVGKPHHHLFDCLKAIHPYIDKSRTLMIGDSIRADIGFAKNVGLDSALVLTGAGTLESVRELPGLEPDYILPSLAAFCPQ